MRSAKEEQEVKIKNLIAPWGLIVILQEEVAARLLHLAELGTARSVGVTVVLRASVIEPLRQAPGVAHV